MVGGEVRRGKGVEGSVCAHRVRSGGGAELTW